MFSSTLLRRRVFPAALAAAAREIEPRGYKPSATPDLLLAFNGKLEERIDIASTPTYGPGWGYDGFHGAPWGGVQEVRTRQYKVGTLVMDIVDRDNRQSVYQGGVEGIVSKQMLQDPRASLTDAVARVFAVPVRRRPVCTCRARRKWAAMSRWPGGFRE